MNDTVIRTTSGRDSKGRFIKGQTGNPKGRRAMPEDVKEALESLTPRAVEVLEQILNDDDASGSVRVKAAETVLDRVYGKPVSKTDLEMSTGDNGGTIEVVFSNPEQESWSK